MESKLSALNCDVPLPDIDSRALPSSLLCEYVQQVMFAAVVCLSLLSVTALFSITLFLLLLAKLKL